jgi:hypothetical protein
MKLSSVLEALALDTWERLRDSRLLEINFGEETITDLLLLDLKRKRPPRSRVIQTPKSKEKDQGTDWEWWIGSDRTSWLRFAVQAKKLHIPTLRYRGLSHKVGSKLQLDLLERYAAANGAIPLYCFYNYATAPETNSAWRCCRPAVDEPQLACTVTPSRHVRTAISSWGKKNFLSMHSHPETLPWRCLAECPSFKRIYSRHSLPPPTSDDLASRVLGADIRRFANLPPELESARESGTLDHFSPQFYDAEVRLYPRRVVVLEFDPEEESVN